MYGRSNTSLGLPDMPLMRSARGRQPAFVSQANKWVKNMERDNRLVVLQPKEKDYHRSICQCIRKGIPVLLENVDEVLDPILAPLLLKQVFRESGGLNITIGDQTVEYHEGFRFYMTVNLPRPHFKPEVSVKVTVVNFAITYTGLTDQLLQQVSPSPLLKAQTVAHTRRYNHHIFSALMPPPLPGRTNGRNQHGTQAISHGPDTDHW